MVSAPSDDVEAADVAAADTVAWRADPDPRPRRLLRYAGVGLLGGVSLVALSLFAYVAVATALGGGDPDALLLFVTLALVGGPLSLVYLLVAVDVAGTDRLRELLAGFAPEDVSPAGALLASVATALLVVALARVSFPLVTGYLAALALLWVVVSARHTAGELDVEARTLSTETGGRRRTFDVSTLASFSAVAVGGYVVCLLRYEAGTVSNPFLAVFPAADWPAVREGLERLREAEAGSVQPAVRVALAAFGLLFLGVAGGVVLLGGRSGAGPAVAYAVVALGGLGLLMVVLAAMG